MKKRALFLIMLLSILTSLTFFISCRKKDDNSPKAKVYPIGASIDGTYYYAQILDSVSSYQSWFNAQSVPVNIANANYVAFKFTDNSGTYAPTGFPYGFVLAQLILTGTDTIATEIDVFSSNPITAGNYTIYSDNITTPPITSGTYATAYAQKTSLPNFNDSTTVGYVNITQMDTINRVASGTYSFINTGSKYNGAIPLITVSNGRFTNMNFQKF
jgi:hypothetical protein